MNKDGGMMKLSESFVLVYKYIVWQYGVFKIINDSKSLTHVLRLSMWARKLLLFDEYGLTDYGKYCYNG